MEGALVLVVSVVVTRLPLPNLFRDPLHHLLPCHFLSCLPRTPRWARIRGSRALGGARPRSASLHSWHTHWVEELLFIEDNSSCATRTRAFGNPTLGAPWPRRGQVCGGTAQSAERHCRPLRVAPPSGTSSRWHTGRRRRLQAQPYITTSSIPSTMPIITAQRTRSRTSTRTRPRWRWTSSRASGFPTPPGA